MMNNKLLFDEAAEWMLRIQAAPLTEEQQQELQCWCQQSKAHLQTWQKAEKLLRHLNCIPSDYSYILEQGKKSAQYQLAGKLVLILSLGSLGGLFWQSDLKDYATADYATRAGQQKQIQLSDGTQVTLNTQTAIDIDYAKNQRNLKLRYGEILIQTAAEKNQPYRPFIVSNQHANMQALGTVFSVKYLKSQKAQSCVGVIESAVKITLKHNRHQHTVHAGEQICFDAQHFYPQQPLNPNMYAWKNGMLMADQMPLQDLVTEINRYQHGYIQVDASLRQMKISGSFAVNDIDTLARALELSYPIQVKSYLQHYVVNFVPQQSLPSSQQPSP